ncbi:hypothetical protein [Nevskia sp.]|uniref:hypothetical protein n=1 Tax=Nevskia sp. TaxID=1929292 RepID=UPI0025FE02BF|nr:hypothetical protein [Nevskia sp.]
MVSITGSVKANRFVGPALLDAGFVFAGEGQPYRETPYEATAAPSIFIMHLSPSSADAAPKLPGAAP